MSEKVPILVILGTDVDGKWHAAKFDESELTMVTRAAGLMDFTALRVAADHAEAYAVAEALPVGKIFSSGKAFVPFVARVSFDTMGALAEHGAIIQAEAPPEIPTPQRTAALFTSEAIISAEALWSKIEIGTVVLAAQPDIYGPGWWESVVVGIEDGDLTLRWVEDGSEPPFRMPRRGVALLLPVTPPVAPAD